MWKESPEKREFGILETQTAVRFVAVTLHSDPPFLLKLCQMYMRIRMNFPRLTETLDEAKPGRIGAMSIDIRRKNRRIVGNQKVGQVDGWTGRVRWSNASEGRYPTMFKENWLSSITNRYCKLAVSRGSTTKGTRLQLGHAIISTETVAAHPHSITVKGVRPEPVVTHRSCSSDSRSHAPEDM